MAFQWSELLEPHKNPPVWADKSNLWRMWLAGGPAYPRATWPTAGSSLCGAEPGTATRDGAQLLPQEAWWSGPPHHSCCTAPPPGPAAAQQPVQNMPKALYVMQKCDFCFLDPVPLPWLTWVNLRRCTSLTNLWKSHIFKTTDQVH